MHVLVTGITGFVGGHLAEHLIALGHRVTGCARQAAWPPHLRHLADSVQLLGCDLQGPDAAARLFSKEAYDAVFHLAGLADPRACRADPALAVRENSDTARQLYEGIRRSDQRPRVLFVSSSYVYGHPGKDQLPIRTDCTLRTDHPYAASKWQGEQISLEYGEKHGLDIVRVRPFNHTGPRQPVCYVVPDWAMQIVAMERGEAPPLLQVGNLNTRRDYTDVRDVVRGYQLLVRLGESGEVYNLGSGISRSGREMLEAIRSLSRVPFDFELDPARMRDEEAREIVADATPLKNRTGWEPGIALPRTLEDTLNFWRNQR